MLETHTRCFVHHVKGLFDPAVLTEVVAHFDAVEGERQACLSRPDEQIRLRIGASTDAFRMDPVWYEPWRRPLADTIDRIRPYTWLLFPVMIRHITQPGHLVPWHQDIGYLRRMSVVHRRVITCFVPLDPFPSQVAGLEFALGDFEEFPHATHSDHGAAITDVAFNRVVRHSLSFGDALVFGDHTPHRTVSGPNGIIDRRSFEFRAVIPEEALEGRDYFDLERGHMVRCTAAGVIDSTDEVFGGKR